MAGKGNKNAQGNKGGGRPSAYQELANAKALHDFFFKEIDVNALKEKIMTGKYSVFEMLCFDALSEEGQLIRNKMADKIMPDRLPEDDEGNTQKIKIYLPKQK